MVFPQNNIFKNKIALKLKLTNLKKAQFKEITLLQIQKLFVTQIQASFFKERKLLLVFAVSL